MKTLLKFLSLGSLLIMSLAVQASDITKEEASDLLNRSGTVQARYEKVNIALEDPEQAIEASHCIFTYGIPGFLSTTDLSHIDPSGEILKDMSLTFENGGVYLPQNGQNELKKQKTIVIKLYQEILDTFCWEKTEDINFSYTTEVTASEVAAIYVARQRLQILKKTWKKV